MKKTLIIGSIIFAVGFLIWLVVIMQDGFTFGYSDAKFTKKEQTFGEIKHLEYEGDADDLLIKYQENQNGIVYYDSAEMCYHITYNENTKTLKIEQETKNFILGFNFPRNKEIIITIGNPLDSLELDLDAGDIDFEMVNINRAEVNVDAGDVEFSNCQINTLSIEVDAGKIDYSGKIFQAFNGNVDAGEIDLELAQNRNDFIVNGSGNGAIVIQAKVNLGKFDIEYND